MSDKPSYSVSDLSRRWSCRPDHVRNLIAAGKLEAINLSISESSKRPTYKILLEEVLRFESARSTKPLPKPPRRRKRKDPNVIPYSDRMRG